MSKTPLKPNASKILSNVPLEHAFRFCAPNGVCTQTSAISLEDFVDKLDGIDDSFILFHYLRGDFQAWIRDSVGDRELADKMCFIPGGISGQELRVELLKMLQARISELKAQKKEVFPPSQCNKEGLCLT